MNIYTAIFPRARVVCWRVCRSGRGRLQGSHKVVEGSGGGGLLEGAKGLSSTFAKNRRGACYGDYGTVLLV